MVRRKRTDRRGVTRYFGTRTSRPPLQKITVKARFDGEQLVSFRLRFRAPKMVDPPLAPGKYGMEHVTAVEVLPLQ